MKPLLITDCDEVLLHMVRHFGVWLDEAHDIDFTPNGGDFATSMRRRADQTLVQREQMWTLLDGFFPDQMDRQTLVPHAREALAALAEHAEIIVLTNLGDHCRAHRVAQLATHGIAHRVECNQGPKGPPVAKLVAEMGAPVAVFVDDLAVHHESVAKHAPHVHRLHMIAEPSLAPDVPPAPAAHARIDDWREAQRWIEARFAAGLTADAAGG
ncbi:HAD family hydrolase [Sphingomonas psychrotolerans]|uniref:HAD family hydrolase n=1 Tax=Sphingomonas psychrotolerans TaxID=1327635 RepID=A0ABU3N631_9SPHN|nr:HAD family hydrolase [Sphingomonas psychrotolerans]MDT8759989.1 HAD family hydrolase [Sphingomonas psychrotolerans]